MNATPALALAMLLLASGACAKKREVWSDPTLPEQSADVKIVAPRGILQQGAGAPEPSVRARALDLLIRTQTGELRTAHAKQALWDPDGWVQQEAVRALAEDLDNAENVALLEAYLGRTDDLADPYAKGAAAVRLAAADKLGGKDAMMAAWRAEKAPWRAAPLQLGALALGDRDALEPLAKALANGDVALETAFILDVGRSGEPELADALTEGQDWIEDEMILAYAVARLMLGDDSASRPIEQALNGDDPLVALEALDYLVELDHDKVVSLIRKAKTGGSDVARAYAHMALAVRGEEKPDVFLEAMLSDDPEVRALAARLSTAAARHPERSRKFDRVARKVLETTLGDESIRVRLAALRGAAAVGVLMPEPPVRAHLADELLAVRVEAAGALLSRGS